MISVVALAALALSAESTRTSSLVQSRVLHPIRQQVLNQPVLPRSVACLRGGSTDAACDVILIGCGVPKRGMGWYHAKQLLDGDVPSARLTTVVEPWFLGQGADSPPGKVRRPNPPSTSSVCSSPAGAALLPLRRRLLSGLARWRRSTAPSSSSR